MRGKYRPHHILQVVLLFIALAGSSVSNSKANENSKYLDAVREFADNVLKYGRDTYGPKHTPLFVDGLNVNTHEPVKWISPKGDPLVATETEEWIISNFASQQTLLRTLDGLSTLTGDPKYRDTAMQAIKYAFENLRTPNGLFYWGHNVAYDAQTDKVYIPYSRNHHGAKTNYPYYELLWQVDPDATKRFIEAFWSAHILDWSNLDFCRISVPFSETLKLSWDHEYKGGPTFFISKRPWGAGFLSTATSLIHSGATLYQFSKQEQPFVWSERLMRRFMATRNPKTGITAHLYNQSQRMFPNEGMKESFTDPYTTVFPQQPFQENKIVMNFGENWQPLAWISLLLVGDSLGEHGKEFTRWVLEELTAWGNASYRLRDNSFVPILTDGTPIEGVVLEETCSLGLKGDIANPLFAGPSFFWLYAGAYRVTGDAFMWEMVRNIGIGNGFGDIGGNLRKSPELNIDTTSSDVYGLLGFLELYAKTNKSDFLSVARAIADNIVEEKLYKGFFVPSKEHVYTRFDCFEPLALLHLVEALDARKFSVPRVWPTCTMYVSNYRFRYGNASDRWYIYELRESSNVPWSLAEASHIGDIHKVEELLNSGVDVDSCDNFTRMTPLYVAASRGHKEVVQLLCAYGANVNGKNEIDMAPLTIAMASGHIDIAELLIEKGAQGSESIEIGMAIQSNNLEKLKELIARGVNLNVRDGRGETPLLQAIRAGKPSFVETLISGGADVNARDNRGRTPLHLAVARGNKEVVELLIASGADVNVKDDRNNTPLDLAKRRRRTEIIEILTKAAEEQKKEKEKTEEKEPSSESPDMPAGAPADTPTGSR